MITMRLITFQTRYFLTKIGKVMILSVNPCQDFFSDNALLILFQFKMYLIDD